MKKLRNRLSKNRFTMKSGARSVAASGATSRAQGSSISSCSASSKWGSLLNSGMHQRVRKCTSVHGCPMIWFAGPGTARLVIVVAVARRDVCTVSFLSSYILNVLICEKYSGPMCNIRNDPAPPVLCSTNGCNRRCEHAQLYMHGK